MCGDQRPPKLPSWMFPLALSYPLAIWTQKGWRPQHFQHRRSPVLCQPNWHSQCRGRHLVPPQVLKHPAHQNGGRVRVDRGGGGGAAGRRAPGTKERLPSGAAQRGAGTAGGTFLDGNRYPERRSRTRIPTLGQKQKDAPTDPEPPHFGPRGQF